MSLNQTEIGQADHKEDMHERRVPPYLNRFLSMEKVIGSVVAFAAVTHEGIEGVSTCVIEYKWYMGLMVPRCWRLPSMLVRHIPVHATKSHH